MDFKGTNAATRVVEGDVRSFMGAPALQRVVLPAGKVIQMSADDLVSWSIIATCPSKSGGGGLLGKCEIRRDSVFPNLEEEDALWSL